MATPKFTFTYDENPYLKSALDYQLLAVDAAQEQYRYQADRQMAKARQTQTQTNRAATANYYNAINPYGAQADSLASGGLARSGIAQSSAARNYSTYQGALGQSASDYANTQADVNTSMLSYAAQANADKLSARASYQTSIADDYNQSKSYNFGLWQDYQDRQYQKNRDRILDERYSKEWAYKTGHKY